MLKPELLAILCCPETYQPLNRARADVVEMFNRKVATGALKTRNGKPIREAIDAALVRQDGQCAYFIREGIPVMLIDQAIAL